MMSLIREHYLSDHHAQHLRDSAISPEVIAARGYRTVNSKAELQRLGFSANQCLVPGLLIPIYGTNGEIAFHMLRPDEPRMRDGKAVKYEFPCGVNMAVDVPPMARQWIRDPKRPLVITEGAKKADSAVSAGLCCISVLGVWSWRGTNEFGGKTALPDWEEIAIKGREIYLAFDSDAMEKPAVYEALRRLSDFLKGRGAL